MLKDTNYLRRQAAETASTLGGRVVELERALREKAKRFSPVEQVREHPFSAVGIAAVVGFLAAFSPKQRAISVLNLYFGKELGIAKALLTALALEAISKKIEPSSTSVSEAINEIKNNLLKPVN